MKQAIKRILLFAIFTSLMLGGCSAGVAPRDVPTPRPLHLLPHRVSWSCQKTIVRIPPPSNGGTTTGTLNRKQGRSIHSIT